MSLSEVFSHWRSDPSIAANIACWNTIPERQPRYAPLPDALDNRLVTFLHDQGIDQLYLHQLRTWEDANAGKNVAICTGTASGKTLAYQLPVLQSLLTEERSRTFFLFPTKALAHDQLSALQGSLGIQAASYDGDTPKHHRPQIRDEARLIVTNPDMLHLGILPHHTNWDSFFSQLKYVVIDEMHTYRGVFGSHVANVIRRLKRISEHYGRSPQFILTSATIGNPQELAQNLIEEPVSVIDDDASTRGEKHFIIYNPPVIDKDLGLRAGMQRESVRLVSDLISYQVQTILFGRSRKSVEFMLTELTERSAVDPDTLRAYRSGYLPSQRRKIEHELRHRQALVVVATTALELGIDIGGMDASVLAGYPGTISGTWQQAGRSGRSHKPSLSILVTSSSPLDQYFAHQPDYLFSTPPEQALIDANNLLILFRHIQCAAFELPFSQGERYGNLSRGQTLEFLSLLEQQGTLHASQETYFWMEEGYPASDISLRSSGGETLTLTHVPVSGKKKTIGTIDRESATWMVHPGAIYLHQGQTYQVDTLNLEEGFVHLVDAYGDYYTEPVRKTDVECLSLDAEKAIPGGQKVHGELSVTQQVTGYKKIQWGQYKVLSRTPLDLPAVTLETTGYWLSLDEDTVQTLISSGSWNSGPLQYGPHWDNQREAILARDDYRCRVCGKQKEETQLHIHHRQPLRSFQSRHEANRAENLITVCPRCHQRVENVVRVRSGLAGLAHLLHHLAPLHLMCDSRDIGVHVDPESELTRGLPTIVIFEQIPAGVGFSQRLYERHAVLIQNAFDQVASCPCQDGCPSCVGPGGELGSGGKEETIAILKKLCHNK